MANKKQAANSEKQPSQAFNQETVDPSYEVNSYNSMLIYSDYYFGLNIFEFMKPEDLQHILQDPMANNQMLRNLSMMLYNTSGVFTNTVDYMTAMPTLDRVVVTHGKNTDKKRKNKETMESTLKVVKDKEFVRDALFRGMLEGIAFYYFETTQRPLSRKKFMSDYEVDSISEINELGINASIISLPTDYTKIVGMKNSSYVIAFNLDYFTLGDSEPTEQKLRKYPQEIRDAFHNKKRTSNWVVLDNTKTIVNKIRSKRDEKYGRPLVLAAISDILYGDYFTKTKRNVLDDLNNKIVYETFPEGKEKGTSALTKKQQESQHNSVKNAVMNKNNKGGVSFFSVAAGTKIDSLDVANTDLFDDKYESNLNDKIALDMGIAASLLNGSASGSYNAQENNLALLTSQIMMWVSQIENELNKCISANIIKDKKNWVECRYLPLTYVNRKQMIDSTRSLYMEGKGSIALWVAACGIDPDIFFALLDHELEMDYENKYPIHATSYTRSNNDKSPGRPETDNPTDETIKSRLGGKNNLPSPSDNK